MEAAAARAARSRWEEPPRSQLQRLIQSACSPENFEPNLAANLDIVELINTKKASAPREAAVAIVGYVNSRNPNVAMLAMHLLDMCVKNCGYAFHLQISTKEFLNELVRRFPEQPPPRPTRIQTKILEAIEEWRCTICETSRYKEDLGFIRDMHRLLRYKGYRFPEVRREDLAVMNPTDNLKSVEEMEAEEREAQSAKLQELIRRATPADLQEANRLMKIMTGYDTRTKTNHRAKAAEDLAKIQAKARILEERLDAFLEGDTMDDGDVFGELASSLMSVQPKLQKMCEEESDDAEAVAKMNTLAASIERIIARYRLLKGGEVEAARSVAQGGPIPEHVLSTASAASRTSSPAAAHKSSKSKKGKQHKKSVTTTPVVETSLIDLGGEGEASSSSSAAAASPAPAPTTSAKSSVETDLLGLSLDDPPPSGSIALGFGANANIPGPALLSSLATNDTAKGSTTAASDFSPFASLTSRSTTPQPGAGPSSTPAPPFASNAFGAPSPSAKSLTPSDPFASLRPTSTSPVPSFSAPAAKSATAMTNPVASKQQTNPTSSSEDDDEWSFSSALPTETLPATHEAVIHQGTVKVEMHASRGSAPGHAIQVAFAFSNTTAATIRDLHFQIAVTKGFELELLPQTGRVLSPNQARGIQQYVRVWHAGDRHRRVDSAKLRWRLAYTNDQGPHTDQGQIPEFSLA